MKHEQKLPFSRNFNIENFILYNLSQNYAFHYYYQFYNANLAGLKQKPFFEIPKTAINIFTTNNYL